MPRPPTIHDTPRKVFVCAHCNRDFRSNAGRTRHVNAKHSGRKMNSPQSESEETNPFSDINSCPGFDNFDLPSHTGNSDAFDFDGGDFNFDNTGTGRTDSDNTPPLSPGPSRDSASTSTEYHSGLNGKTNNLWPLERA